MTSMLRGRSLSLLRAAVPARAAPCGGLRLAAARALSSSPPQLNPFHGESDPRPANYADEGTASLHSALVRAAPLE